MESLALAVLGVPLSIWCLGRAYAWLIADSRHAAFSSWLPLLGLAAVVIRANLSLIQKFLYDRRARALGCGRVAVYPHKDPILGLDSFFEGLRASNSHRLLDLYASRFASCGTTHYSLTLGSWVLMTSDAENIKAILATKMDDWPIDGPRLLAALPVLGPDSIFTSNGPAWQRARGMLKPSFVRHQLADLDAHFGRHIANLLAAVPADGAAFDVQALLLDMTMDSSTDFLLGYSADLLTTPSPEARQFVRDFEYASRESAKKARLGPVLYHLPHRELRDAVRRLRGYVRSYLERADAEKRKKKGEGEGEGDGEAGRGDRKYVFLDELLKTDPPADYTVDQILSILVAGRDTTAAAMTAAFHFLARSPAAVEKLREEIGAVGEESPTWEQLKQLRYLNNVIKEGKDGAADRPCYWLLLCLVPC